MQYIKKLLLTIWRIGNKKQQPTISNKQPLQFITIKLILSKFCHTFKNSKKFQRKEC